MVKQCILTHQRNDILILTIILQELIDLLGI